MINNTGYDDRIAACNKSIIANAALIKAYETKHGKVKTLPTRKNEPTANGFTVQQAAKYLKVSQAVIRAGIHIGHLFASRGPNDKHLMQKCDLDLYREQINRRRR